MKIKAKNHFAKAMLKNKTTANISELDLHNLLKFFGDKESFNNHYEILGGK